MTEIPGEFGDIAFVGFGEARHALASIWIRLAHGTTRAYVLKLRSVIIKGLEALTTECLLAARRAAEEVCVTLRAFGLSDWMSRGTVAWRKKLASLDMTPGEDNLAQRADTVLARL